MMDFLSTSWGPDVIAIVVALGIGLLIGVERERRKGEGPALACRAAYLCRGITRRRHQCGRMDRL